MKTFIATTERDNYTVKYIIKDYSKEFAEQRIFEISGEHLSVREVK